MGRPPGSKNAMPGIMRRVAARTPKAIYRSRAKRREKVKTKVRQAAEMAAFVAMKQPPPTQPNDISFMMYQQFKQNPLAWGHIYFENHFRMNTPAFHTTLVGAAMQHRYLSVASPRESSKSTLLSFLYPFHGITFKRFHFIVILSNTFTKAAMYLDSMKAEVNDNREYIQSFNDPITIVKDAEGDSEFRHPDGFTTKVICKGRDQIGDIRGVKFGAYRPDLVIMDDIEDDEMVENPDQRIKLQKLIDEAVMKAGDAQTCQYIIIGTILHDDSQLAKMNRHQGIYQEFHKLFFQAHIDPDGLKERSLWPEKWSVADLKWLREHKPGVYSKEMQNDPVAGASRIFNQEDFRYWKLEMNGYQAEYILYDKEGQVSGRGNLRDCKGAIAMDLAWKKGRTADFCVIMPGLLTPNADLLIWEYIAKKAMRPDEIEEVLFPMESRLKDLTGSSVPIGMEKAQIENVTKWFLREAMRRRNQPLYFREAKWDTDKKSRIEVRLENRYSQHMIFHLHGQGELEHQLTRFPAAAHDDLPDAEQILVQMLQYPKKPQKETAQPDTFMELRRLSQQGQRRYDRGLFKISAPQFPRGIPSQTSPIG